MNVHRRVGLRKAVLYLTVDHLGARHRQALVDEVAIEANFGFRGATNQLRLITFGAQRVAQGARRFHPVRLQLAVVEQRDNNLIAHRREIVDLKQLMAQHAVIADRRDHFRHYRIDQLAGGGKAIDANTLARRLIENDVVEIVAIVPETKLRAHPVVADRRAKHLRFRRGERRHHRL